MKNAILGLLAPGASGGYILRTAAQGVSVESLQEDMAYLDKLWHHVRVRAVQTEPGEIVHEDLPLALRVLRDELARGVSRVLVDSSREHADMVAFAAAFMPDAATRIEQYAGPRPIPGHGPHRYRFLVFALDQPIPDAVATAKALLRQMARGVLARGTLIGTYER